MNKRRISFFLSLIGMVFLPYNIYPKHIIGGDVFYECTNIDMVNQKVQLHFEFQMYRDNRCISRGEECAYFDGDPRDPNMSPGAQFGVYELIGESWSFVKETPFITPDRISKVPVNSGGCVQAPPGIDIERGVYFFDIDLDIIEENYIIAYQRCCRSEVLTNLVNPGSFGAVFSVEVTPEAIKSCNNSPVFNEFPPLVICAGFELEYDNSASDKEGDQVVYEFCTPLSSGGTNGMADRTDCNSTPVPDPSSCTPNGFRNIVFLAPSFTDVAPMGGNPVVAIDPNTGLIAGVPEIIGEHAMAVCANEYRDGVLLSTIRRDFHFIVTACEEIDLPEINNDVVVFEFRDLREMVKPNLLIENELYSYRLINNSGNLNISENMDSYEIINPCQGDLVETIEYEICICSNRCQIFTTTLLFDLNELLTPITVNDTLLVIQSDRTDSDLLLNDSLVKEYLDFATIEITNDEQNVDIDINNLESVEYVIDLIRFEDYVDTFIYELCYCDNFCSSSIVEVIVRNDIDPTIEKVISPNGDGINDMLNTAIPDLAVNFPNNELLIFNRWGSVVYDIQPYDNNWSGHNNSGQDLPEGTYYVLFKLNARNNFQFRGSVTVIR